jgi:hypothetical protein
MKVFTNYFILLWLVISLIWCALVGILLPPVGAQINYWAVVGYLVAGPLIVAVILVMLHSVDSDIFFSLEKATPIGAIFLAIFALFGYLITAERESRSKFLEKQLDICADIAEIVGTLATQASSEEWLKAFNKFWSYYWGRLGVFENTEIERRMVEFGDVLWNVQAFDLHHPALCVAHTCKAQARASWSVVPGLIRPGEQDDAYCIDLDNQFKKFCSIHRSDQPPHTECGAAPIKG